MSQHRNAIGYYVSIIAAAPNGVGSDSKPITVRKYFYDSREVILATGSEAHQVLIDSLDITRWVNIPRRECTFFSHERGLND